MAKSNTLGKRIQIDKANARVVFVLVIAAFITTFSMVSSRALLNQRSYQSRVIKEKSKAATTLKQNLTAANTVAGSYKAFVSSSTNVIGGNATGQGDNDGDNAKIVLDALPSKYDFPALAASLEKVLLDKKFKINGITGNDDELAQSNNTSPNPLPLEMPFELSITGPYDNMNVLFDVFERSIRPFHVKELTLSGTNKETNLKLNAKTYYQPEKNLNITTKVVK